jgi:uncharacterized protein
MADHGTFYWNELMTRDAEKAKAFYAATLNWTFDAMSMAEGGTYWLAKVGEKPVGGIFTMAGPQFEGVPEHWFAYVAVDDVDADAARAEAAGGTIVRPAFDVPGVGRIVILKDVNGAAMGWITPAAQD